LLIDLIVVWVNRVNLDNIEAGFDINTNVKISASVDVLLIGFNRSDDDNRT